jgi:hypothetical protein
VITKDRARAHPLAHRRASSHRWRTAYLRDGAQSETRDGAGQRGATERTQIAVREGGGGPARLAKAEEGRAVA